MHLLNLITTLVATSAVAAPLHDIDRRALKDDSAPHQDDPNFISATMRAHWYWRRLHCAQDLVWDVDLAAQARRDVETCTQKPEHMRAGSNLSSMSPAPGSYDDWIEFARMATHGWHEEETKYPYDNPHFEASWGHFTQMVWRNSSRLGCAIGRCSDDVEYPARFYCYYSFFGNNIAAGQFEAQVWGPVCRDPSPAEAHKRRDVGFDWTVSH